MCIYRLLVLLIAASVQIYCQGNTPTYSWTTMPYALPDKDIVSYDGAIVLYPHIVGLFGGRNPDSLEPLLTRIEFGQVEGYPTVKTLRSGALLVSGGPGPGFYVRESSRDTLRWLRRDTLGGPLPGGQLRETVGIESFEPSAFHAHHAYSVNSGSTWTRVMPPDSVKGWEAVAYGKNEGFVVKDMERGTWYRLDIGKRDWATTDILPEIDELVFLKNGAAVAIGEMPKYHTRLYARASGSAPWIEVDGFLRADGDTIAIDQLGTDFEGVLSALDDSTAIIGFKYGVAAVLNGHTVTVHSIPEAYRSKLVTMSGTGSDTVLLSYSDRFVVLDVRTGERTIIPYPPVPVNWMNSVVLDNTIVVHDNTGSGMLWVYDLRRRVWNLRGRVVHDGETTRPVGAGSIVVHQGKVLAWVGQRVAIECDTVPTILPVVSRLGRGYAADFEMKYGAERFVSTKHGLFHLGVEGLSLITGDSISTLFKDTAACVYWGSQDRLWIGGNKLHLSTDSGATWAELNFGDRMADSSIVSSIDAVSGKPLVIGRRGYIRMKGSEPVDTVRGGILLSEDQGTTWSRIVLPVEGAWVERIVRGDGGCLFAWTTEMRRYAGSTGVEYRHQAWALLRSCDDGRTWIVVLTRPFDGLLARPGSWHLASSGRAVVVSATDRIFASTDDGDTWDEQVAFPFDTWYTSMAYDDVGSLWIGSDKGIFRIEPSVHVDDAPGHRRDNTPLVTLSPNPSMGIIRLNIPAELLPVSTLWIVDEGGRVVVDLTGNIQHGGGGEMPINTSGLAPGVYFFVLHHGSASSTVKFLKR